MILSKTVYACHLLTCQVIVLIRPVVRETALGLQDLSGLLESLDVLGFLDRHDSMVPSCLRPKMTCRHDVTHQVSTIQALLGRLVIAI